MREPSQLEQIQDFIRKQSPKEVAKRSKISRRTLEYILKGDYCPRYETLQKLLREMEKA